MMEDIPEELRKPIDAEKRERREEKDRYINKSTTSELRYRKKRKRKKKLATLNRRRGK